MATKGGRKSAPETKVSSSNGGKSPAPANAWSRPLQSKRTTAPPPGMGAPGKPMVATSGPLSMSQSVAFIHRERLLHLSLTLVGQKVVLHQTNGAIVEGIFHTFTPFSSLPADQRNRYVLKETIIKQQPSTETAIKDGITLIIPASKVVFLHAVDIAAGLKNNNNMNGMANSGEVAKGGFATDTQISGATTNGKAKDLVAAGNAWTAAGNSNNSNSFRNQPLEAGGSSMLKATNSRAAALAGNSKGGNAMNNHQGMGGSTSASDSIGQWDQFKANKELFNVNATFDENLYTTQLDTSHIDAKKKAEAERIANEIEGTTTTNIHMAEERGFKVETDFDEEDLYSGVLTKDGKQRHEKVTISKNTGKDKESKSNANPSKSNSSSTSTVPRKVMNYAAAAAKADTSKNKSKPPGFSSNNIAASTPTSKENNDKEETTTGTTDVTTEKKIEEEAEVLQKSTPNKETPSNVKETNEDAETSKGLKKDEPSAKEEKASEDKSSTTKKPSESETDERVETKNEQTEKKAEKKDTKKTSKLNANAKSFTFNPSAKSFTPTFNTGATNNQPLQQPLQPTGTTDPSMQIYGTVHPMQPPHFMQSGPMGQPGMMPILNPQYPGMRYPSAYGMEQPMSQIQHQATHVQVQATPSVPSAPSSGNAPTPTPGSGSGNANVNEEDQTRQKRDDDTQQTPGQSGSQQQSQRSQQHQADQALHSQGHPQQQQIPMPYSVPPNAYFSAGMGMPPRGPGYGQFVAGPQQIGGRPGVPPYGIYPMQPGGMPQNLQMRGPNGNPYYPGPNGPIPYPPGSHMGYPMMDDGGRGRGGRSSNSGRGARGRSGRSGRGGRGRSNYNNNNHNSSGNGGKNSQQQYSHHQSQQQPPGSQQQGQSGNPSSNKSD